MGEFGSCGAFFWGTEMYMSNKIQGFILLRYEPLALQSG
jgi:hypothetical protein